MTIQARASVAFALSMAVAIGACSTPMAPPSSAPDAAVDTGTPPLETLSWQPCESEASSSAASQECTTMLRPTGPAPSDATPVSIAIRRWRPTSARAALVMVNGGPGLSSRSFEFAAARLADRGIAVHLVDLRGTGASTKIECPAALRTPASCLDALARNEALARNLTTTRSAEDLVALAAALRPTFSRIVLFGQSYGSLVAQRVAQLAPTAFDGLLLDGPFDPVAATVSDLDFVAARTVEGVLDACAARPRCASRFEQAPRESLRSTLARMDGGHCARLAAIVGAPGRAALQRLLGLFVGMVGAPSFVPAIVSRAARCSEADVQALGAAFRSVVGAGAGLEQEPLTALHIIRSELWPDPAAVQTLRAGLADASAQRGILDTFGRELPAQWPLAARDELHGRDASSAPETLLLVGEFDASTPASGAARVARALGGELVVVPGAVHGLAVPLITIEPRVPHPCIESLVRAFVLREPRDTRCIDAVAPLDFDGTPEGAASFFRTTNAWD